MINQSTVAGAERCIELSASGMVSEGVTGRACIRKFEGKLSTFTTDALLQGNAGPRATAEGAPYFGGKLSNDTEAYIVTSLSLRVTFRTGHSQEVC